MNGGQERTAWFVLAGGALFYLLLNALFFPSYYSVADEGCTVGMAHLFARGRATGDGQSDLNLYHFRELNGRLVSVQDAGYPTLLAPLTFFGHLAPFAFNILVHAAGTVVFYLLLRRLGLPGAFCLLYLLHPTLWYHSRSLVNNFPAGVFLLAGVYFFLRGTRASLWAGVCWGLAIVLRPSDVVFLVPLLAAWLVFARVKSRGAAPPPDYADVPKRLARVLLGGVPLLVPLLAYNLFVTGTVTGFVAGRVVSGGYALSNVPSNLLRYGVALNVFYPAMFLLFFFYRGPLRGPLFAAVIVGSFPCMTFVDWGLGAATRSALVENVILGPRYLEGILPLMILAYAAVLHPLALRFGRAFWGVFAAGVLLLAVGDAAITVVHQRHMDQAAFFRDQLFGRTPKGALILMDETVRSRISADVVRPRRLALAFPFDADNGLARLDALLREHGEAYVPVLRTGGEADATPDVDRDREAFLARHPSEAVVDVSRKGWHLTIARVRPGDPPFDGAQGREPVERQPRPAPSREGRP